MTQFQLESDKLFSKMGIRRREKKSLTYVLSSLTFDFWTLTYNLILIFTPNLYSFDPYSISDLIFYFRSLIFSPLTFDT